MRTTWPAVSDRVSPVTNTCGLFWPRNSEVSGGTASDMPEDDEADELGAVAVGVPVAPAMPVAAVVGPVAVVDVAAPVVVAGAVVVAAADDELLEPLVLAPASPPGGTVPTGEPGTDVSADDDVDSGELPVPDERTPVKSLPVIPTRVSGSVPPLTMAADSSASAPWA